MSAAETLNQEVGHTAGPWFADDIFVSSSERKHEIVSGCSPDISREELRANARLIAEAGTVAHETGMTPRQLADELTTERVISFQRSEEIAVLTFQRNELLEALKDCAEALALTRDKLGLCGEGDGQGRKNNSDDDAGSLVALTAARSAIKASGGQS